MILGRGGVASTTVELRPSVKRESEARKEEKKKEDEEDPLFPLILQKNRNGNKRRMKNGGTRSLAGGKNAIF